MIKQTSSVQSQRLPGYSTFVLLGSRLFLFLFFQALTALIFNSWEDSEKYWLLTATLTNLVSIAFLYFLFKREGVNYLSIFKINRQNFKSDIMIFILITLISLPLIFVPGYFLSVLIWNDPAVPADLMFRPVEPWLTYFLLLAFPVTIAFAELATYFAYIMPGLRNRFRSKWPVILLPVIFLSIQHCTLPFIPDLNFILYRGFVFLPFATLIGISIYYRPSLFPYFAILHGLLDFGTALMFLVEQG
jgi:hypothetical protein